MLCSEGRCKDFDLFPSLYSRIIAERGTSLAVSVGGGVSVMSESRARKRVQQSLFEMSRCTTTPLLTPYKTLYTTYTHDVMTYHGVHNVACSTANREGLTYTRLYCMPAMDPAHFFMPYPGIYCILD